MPGGLSTWMTGCDELHGTIYTNYVGFSRDLMKMLSRGKSQNVPENLRDPDRICMRNILTHKIWILCVPGT